MPIATKISTLWIFVLFNMVFADVLSFMDAGFLAQVATGTVEGIEITPMLLLVSAVFLEIAIAMVVLSRFLSPRPARIANMIAASITILFVVGGGSLKPHYIFFATFEVLALGYIFVLARRLR